MLPEYPLHVEPKSSGYETFIIRPVIGYLGLLEASGRVLTPYGPIEVTWKSAGRYVIIDTNISKNTTGRLEILQIMRMEADVERKEQILLVNASR